MDCCIFLLHLPVYNKINDGFAMDSKDVITSKLRKNLFCLLPEVI